MSLAPERVSIGLRRLFTSPGVDPYDEVVWERRDARISNWKDGTVAFEQRDVEFPVSWSVNATNIVAQKYFRGTLGTPERESSLRQVVDRVVDTITRWGIEGGYFVDDGEAEAFNAELKYILVTQRAAFNSPVWFNIGVKGVPQQASACQPYDSLVSTPAGLIPIGELVDARCGRCQGVRRQRAHAVSWRPRRMVASGCCASTPSPDTRSRSRPTISCGRPVAAVAPGSSSRPASCAPATSSTWHRTESWGDGEIAPWRHRRGGTGRLAPGRRLRRAVRPRHQPFAHDRVPDGDRRRARSGCSTHVDTRVPGRTSSRPRRSRCRIPALVGRRIRLYGESLRPFVERWGLLARGADDEGAVRRCTTHHSPSSPPTCAACSRRRATSRFVSARAVVGLDMVGEAHVRGVQTLLSRFGIFARVRRKNDARARSSRDVVALASVRCRTVSGSPPSFRSSMSASNKARNVT